MHVVEFSDVSFGYGAIPVLERVTFSVEPAEFFGLIGPNAAGKSTLLKVMLGLLRPQRGLVRLLEVAPEQSRHRVGYVPQHATFPRDFPLSVREAVLTGRIGGAQRFGPFSRDDHRRAKEVLEVLEIGALAARPINALSGGQLQRVLIARALVCDPELLVLDEPTANVDLRAEEDIFALLRQANSRMAIILVSHDVAFISGYVNRVGCLNRTLACHRTGEIGGRTIEELYGAPVRAIDHAH
jgi:zinc transport system ATP-binding protein